MNEAALAEGAQWLAVVLCFAALAAGAAAVAARTLLAACLYVCAAAASMAASVVALGDSDAALALVIVGAGWAPVVLLAGVTLSSRVAKSARKGAPWISAAAAALTAAAIVWAAHGRVGDASTAAAQADAPLNIWFALLALAAGAACIALLGYGERGAIQHDRTGSEG
jgi:hypothetical protein